MGTDAPHEAQHSLLTRVITGQAHRWVPLTIGLLLVLGPPLAAYEARVRAARTWPYNTAMLRTLFVSFVFPAGAAMAGFLSDVLFR